MFRLEDFFSIADNRWEINHFERTIDFGKDTELSALYFALKENEKLVVNEVLDNFVIWHLCIFAVYVLCNDG